MVSPKKKVAAPKKAAQGPNFKELICMSTTYVYIIHSSSCLAGAIVALKDRNGSSRQAIKKVPPLLFLLFSLIFSIPN
jgi:hypothetical protein